MEIEDDQHEEDAILANKLVPGWRAGQRQSEEELVVQGRRLNEQENKRCKVFSRL